MTHWVAITNENKEGFWGHPKPRQGAPSFVLPAPLFSEELRRFTGHTGGVQAVAFSPDGKTVVTASADGSARLWYVDRRDTITYLCSHLLRDFTGQERTQYNIADKTPTCPGK